MKSPYSKIAEERGFTLVEILVAMALVAIFMGGLMAMFVGFTKSYTTENVKAEVQQVVRGGVEHMVPYIRMAGYDPLTWDEPPQTTTDDHPLDSDEAGFKLAERQKIRFTMDLNKDAKIDLAPPADGVQERITYEYFPGEDGGTIKRILYEDSADPQEEPIVSNVTDFSFTYYDEDNSELSPPVSDDLRKEIRTVVIKMTVREPAGREGFISRTYETRVRSRNLKD